MTGEQTWTVGDFSVLVLVHGRADHLRRLLAGVNASKLRPTEVVIVYMDDSCPAPLRCDVPLRIIHISSSQSHSGLPLSQAPPFPPLRTLDTKAVAPFDPADVGPPAPPPAPAT